MPMPAGTEKTSGRRCGSGSILHRPVLLGAVLTVTVLLALFAVYPLTRVLLLSLTDEQGRFSLSVLGSVLTDGRYLPALGRTLLLGGTTAAAATLLGYLFAYTTTRVDVPWKKFLRLMATLPILAPPFILSLSIIFLFGKQGLITRELLGITGHSVYGFGSLAAVQILSFFPVSYLTISGVLASADSSAEEAARSLGAGRFYVFRTVTLPLSLPGVLAGAVLVLIQSLEDFSNPAVVGGAFTTLSVELYRAVTGSYDLRTGAALAVLLLLPTAAAYLLYRHWTGKGSFVTVTGKAARERGLIREGYIRWPLFALCLLASAVILLLYGTAILGSFVRAWGYDYTLTLDQYRRVLARGWDSLSNSVTLGFVSAVLGSLLGTVIACVTVRRSYRGRRLLEGASVLMYAVPGSVLGVAYILAFNTGPLVLTGTGAILVLAFVFRNMPLAVEAGSAALLQVDGSLEEASSVLGAGEACTFRRLILPLLRRPFYSGLVYSFTRALTAVSTVVFLVSPRWKLVTTQIYALFDEAKYSQAAALVTLLMGVLLGMLGVFSLLVNLLLRPRAGEEREA